MISSVGVLVYAIVQDLVLWSIYSASALLLSLKTLYGDTTIVDQFIDVQQDLESAVNDLDGNNKNLLHQINAMTAENMLLNTNCIRYTELNKELTSQVSNIFDNNQSLSNKIDSLNIINIKQQQVTTNLQSTISIFTIENNDLQKHIDDLLLNIDSLHTQLNELNSINQNLNLTNNQFQSSNKNLNDTINELKININDLTLQNNNLFTLNDNLSNQNNVFKSSNDDLQKNISNMNKLNNDLQTNITHINEQNNELKQMYVEATNLYKNLVLMGDSFGKFESKFSSTAAELVESTDVLHLATNDIKNATDALSNMVNTLADNSDFVPTSKLHLIKRSKRTFHNIASQILDNMKKEDLSKSIFILIDHNDKSINEKSIDEKPINDKSTNNKSTNNKYDLSDDWNI